MSLKVVEINTVLTYEIMTSSCLKKWPWISQIILSDVETILYLTKQQKSYT